MRRIAVDRDLSRCKRGSAGGIATTGNLANIFKRLTTCVIEVSVGQAPSVTVRGGVPRGEPFGR